MLYSYKKINIEAPFPTKQCGHSCQTYLVDTYKDHLYARVIGLQENEKFIIHLSLDLLAFDYKYKNELEIKLRQYYKNNNLHLITSATHTHYANSVRDLKYVSWLLDTLYQNIISMNYLEKGNIYTTYNYVHTTACGKSRISNYETNNEYLCLIRFFDDTSNFFNLIIYNCHPTILSNQTQFFSSEYPGYLLKLFEDEYHTDCSFIQGASGDISSRFVRNGQEYKDMIELVLPLYKEVKKLMNCGIEKHLLKLDYSERNIEYKHDYSPIDVSKLRKDLSTRELETIQIGQEIRKNINNQLNNEIFGDRIDEIKLGTWNLGSIKLVFYPNEIFSSYLNGLDLNKKMLVSYSNGYGPYILPIDFPYVTYEMFLDTLSKETKYTIIKEILNA